MNIAQIKEKLRGNLLLFGNMCIPNMFSVPSGPFHVDFAATLSDLSLNKLNLIAPRGHAKSSIGAAVLPLWHIATDPEPKFILLVSKTEGHASRLLQTIKDVLDYSTPFRQIYGYWGAQSAKKWAQNEVVLKDNTYILCRGTGQQVVGLKYGNQRPTLIILDDPEDLNNTKTAESMKFNLDWLTRQLLPARDAKRGRVLVIGTPQHQNCMVEVLAQMEGWVTKRYQALPAWVMADAKLQKDILEGRVEPTPDMALWHELWDAKKLLQEKASQESINRVSAFYSEFQCQIIGDEDQLFKESYLKYYEGELEHDAHGDAFIRLRSVDGADCDELRPVNVFMGIDPASSTRQTADFSTIVPIAVDDKHNRFVLPYFRGHVTPMKLGAKIVEFFDRYQPEKTRIESVGYQEMLREYIRGQRFIPGMEIKENARNAKSARLETMEPMFAQGKVFLLKEHTALIDELLMYPRGKHDDLLDGLYYASKKTYSPTHLKAVVKSSRDANSNDETPLQGWMAA